MKKILTVVMLLAFAGSPVFAQIQSDMAGSYMDGGIAGILRGDSDDMTFGLVSPTQIGNGLRFRLNWNLTNETGNAGFRSRLEASGVDNWGIQGTDQFQTSMSLLRAYGWMMLFDDVLEVRGGRIWDDHLWTLDAFGWGFSSIGVANGVNFHVRPAGGFTLAFGGYGNRRLQDGEVWEDGALRLWGGAGYDFGGGTHIRASFTHADISTNLQASSQINFVDDWQFWVGLMFNRLDDWSNFGHFNGFAQAVFSGLPSWSIGTGVNFNVAVSEYSQANSAATPVAHGSDDFAMSFGAWAAYTTATDVRLALYAFYAIGGAYNFTHGLWEASAFFITPTYDHGQHFVNLLPSVRFNAMPGAVWNSGFLFNIETGDRGAAGGTSNSPLTFGIYTSMRILIPNLTRP